MLSTFYFGLIWRRAIILQIETKFLKNKISILYLDKSIYEIVRWHVLLKRIDEY